MVTGKFAALLEIGEATTRMKDLYDLQVILSRESFEFSLRWRLDRLEALLSVLIYRFPAPGAT